MPFVRKDLPSKDLSLENQTVDGRITFAKSQKIFLVHL